MSFALFCSEVQEKVFSRLKEDNVSVEDSYDILWEVLDNELNITCITEVEECLYDYGFFNALELYDGEYGLDTLNKMDKFRRVKCLLQCVVHQKLHDMEEAYDEWCEENN